MQAAQQENIQDHLRFIAERLETGTFLRLRRMINTLHPAEIAHMLEALAPEDRIVIWRLTGPELRGEILVELSDEVRNTLIDVTDTKTLIEAVAQLETDDLADLVQKLPEFVTNQILLALDNQNRRRLESVLSFPKDSAGGLMNLDVVTVRPDVSILVVLRYLRSRGSMPELTDSLFIVDRTDHYLGTLPITVLLTSDEQQPVDELMVQDLQPIPADLPANEVAMLFEQKNLVSAPVIDGNGRLIGRITVDDVMDVIREEAEHSLMGHAGLAEDTDIFAPVFISARRRSVWLGINLVTAFIASAVIGMFEATIQQVVALAILMPIVASMGGIAGSQTLTLVIRGLALKHIGDTNARQLLFKELGVGAVNGLLWAIVVALAAGIWFDSILLGLVIGVALVVNLVCAALAGALIPILMLRFKIDPALAGSVVLTTITDVIGFIAFLGLATLFVQHLSQ
ncbi:MAG: magnesium transporter [Gammaproteobacteria bacterium]|nr:magnesium transporter [Gammaproteobacteria bacterium]